MATPCAHALCPLAPRLVRPALLGLAFLGLGLCLGCGGAKPKQVGDYDPNQTSESSSSTAQGATAQSEPAEARTGSGEDRSGGGRAATKRKPKKEAADDDYDLSPADCQALSDHYRELLNKSEMEKLEARKLPEKARPKAEQGVQKIVEQGAERWSTACQGIVNSAQKRSRLTCTLDAKELARFNGCWDGSFDNEAKEIQGERDEWRTSDERASFGGALRAILCG